MSRETYTVEGMTCGHCRAAVMDEVGALPGVSSVDVDLQTGAMTVTGDDVDDHAVATALAEAGYALKQ